MRNRTRWGCVVLGSILACLAASSSSLAQTENTKPQPDTAAFVALLEKSGHNYNQVGDDVWSIPFKGNNMKDMTVKLVLVEGELVTLVHIAPRKELRLKEEFLVKLLELNGADDFVKFVLNDDSLYARIDAHARLLDSQELKYVIEQISGAADEAYPKIKDYVTGANEPVPTH